MKIKAMLVAPDTLSPKNWKHVTKITDRNVILVKGQVVFEGSSAELQAKPALLDQFLGI